MRYNIETTSLQAMGSNVGSGGTVSSTGTLIAPTYEPYPQMWVHVGANAAGAIVATLEQSAALASGYTTVGTLAAGSISGMYTYNAGSITQPYLRTTVTATGGTTICATGFNLKLRTVTN